VSDDRGADQARTVGGGLEAGVRVRRGAFELAVRVVVPAGEVVAVVGPNGAGKSTLLRAIAGLEPLDDGRVVLDGAVLDAPGDGRFVRPPGRPAGVLFQDYRLFPHLSALDNVAFGLRFRGAPRREARTTARRWLARVGMEEHAAARPGALSGGQAQRVALARALAPEPDLLLLDEPFAALDAEARLDLRHDLADHLGSYRGSALLVTHDPNDALALADRIVVLHNGRITDEGTTAEIALRPRSSYVARLLGTNLLHGRAHAGTADFGEDLRLPTPHIPDGPVLAAIPPEAITLTTDPPQANPPNETQGDAQGSAAGEPPGGAYGGADGPAYARRDEVRRVLPGGRAVRVHLARPPGLIAEVPLGRAETLGLRPGTAVWAGARAEDVAVYRPRRSEP